MITNEFAEASAELIEIFKYLPKTEVEKIPLKLRDFFEKVANPNYSVKIDPYKSLNEQKIKEKTKDLIAVIYRNYWCNKEEVRLLDEQLNENDKKYEEKLQEKYCIDNIIEKKKQKNEYDNVEEKGIVIIKKEKWYQKIFNKLKEIFKKY